MGSSPTASVRGPDRLARFYRGRSVALNTQHRTIYAIAGRSTSGYRHGLIAGKTLRQLLLAGRCDEEDAAECVASAEARGAHAAGSCTGLDARDIMSSSTASRGPRPRAAKLAQAGAEVGRLSPAADPNSVGRSPRAVGYMCPEQASGRAVVSSDQFSFGAMLTIWSRASDFPAQAPLRHYRDHPDEPTPLVR